MLPVLSTRKQNSVVRVVIGYGLDVKGTVVRFPAGTIYFSLFQNVQTGSGDPPSFLFSEYRDCFPGVI